MAALLLTPGSRSIINNSPCNILLLEIVITKKPPAMKNIPLLICLAAVVVFSCNKPAGQNPVSRLEGKWRMITVQEVVTGAVRTRPSSLQGDVDIQFTSTSAAAGILTGNTPTNDIWQNDYLLGNSNALSIPNLAMTKVMETSWGNEFVANIRSTQKYSIGTDGKLAIETAGKILIFRKI
jgi:hypothetical protein